VKLIFEAVEKFSCVRLIRWKLHSTYYQGTEVYGSARVG
jgi:hypothetical protein